MYLKSLEVQGFKSFPDKTVIRFGDDITAIVGPNGSGKSNISDAIVWVMGEQSTRTLRGAKMEDVIFGGTQKRGAVGFAEATLTLDNSDRALLYDADEVMVTRRYYRSGDSEYYINRQSARLKDIHELFMDTGLGREGYSNIGQGRIDEILSLKSGDRREIFEEAAGISKYRHRKEETERKLATTEDNLMRIGDKVSELEIQLDPLKNQSEKAKKYLAMKDELQGVEVAVWLQTLDKLSESARKAQEDFTSADFVLKQAHEDLDKHYARAEELGNVLREKDAQVENIRVKVSMQEAAGQQLSGQLAVLQGNVANNQDNLKRLEAECKAEDDRSGGVTAQMEQAKRRLEEIDASLAAKRKGIGEYQQTLSAMTANAQGLQKRYLELRGKETELTSQIAAGEAECRSVEASIQDNDQRLEQLNGDLTAAADREKSARGELDKARRELKNAQDAVTVNQNQISGYGLRLQNRTKRRDELTKEQRDVTAQLDGIRAKVQVFQAMERDFESYQKSVRLVMQQGNRLSGIHGPVSRLIRTEDEYTSAIEIALGGAMQQIVVDTEQDGKAAISFLKRTGGGRATFLPLSVIRGKSLTEKGLEQCWGFVGIASKLVSCQDQYRGIVENLLGRIVIVEDMDAAIAMARTYQNRFKIVTLDGQVVNPGGSMTGGSMNKDAGILSRANELEKLTARQKTLQDKLAALEKDLQEAQRGVDEVEYQRSTAAEQLRAAQDSVLTLQGQEKQYAILLQAILDARENAGAERASLEKRRSADRERLAAQKAKLQPGPFPDPQRAFQAGRQPVRHGGKIRPYHRRSYGPENPGGGADCRGGDRPESHGGPESSPGLHGRGPGPENPAFQGHSGGNSWPGSPDSGPESPTRAERPGSEAGQAGPGGPASQAGGNRSGKDPLRAADPGEKQGYSQYGAGLRPAGAEKAGGPDGRKADHRQAVGQLRSDPRHGGGEKGRDRVRGGGQPAHRRIEAEHCRFGNAESGSHRGVRTGQRALHLSCLPAGRRADRQAGTGKRHPKHYPGNDRHLRDGIRKDQRVFRQDL